MEYRPLGRTDLKVSALCLGTMTWGEQNSEQDAFAQIARAKAAGINFMDTAEMYPVPPRAETYASTERIIGNWFRRSGDRADWILASKIAGPGNGISHVRDGNLKFNRQHIVAALDASLERLQTDWLDLYQLHWPERRTNFFGQLGYQHQEESFTPLEETLEVLDEQVRAGKIRHIGLSNETPWGTMTSSGSPRSAAGRARYRSRTPTTCSTAASRWAWRKSPSASSAACWPTRRWPSACFPASTRTAPARPTRASVSTAASPATPTRRRKRPARATWRWPANMDWNRRRWHWPTSLRGRS